MFPGTLRIILLLPVDTAYNIIYCKTTNVSMLLILALLANGIKILILIPANINTQSCGRQYLMTIDNAKLNSR